MKDQRKLQNHRLAGQRVKVCTKCPQWRKTCALWRRPPCNRRTYLRNPLSVCPLGQWEADAELSKYAADAAREALASRTTQEANPSVTTPHGPTAEAL